MNGPIGILYHEHFDNLTWFNLDMVVEKEKRGRNKNFNICVLIIKHNPLKISYLFILVFFLTLILLHLVCSK